MTDTSLYISGSNLSIKDRLRDIKCTSWDSKDRLKSNLLVQKIMIQAHYILLCIFYTKLMTLCAGSSRGHRTLDSQSCHHCSCQPPLSMQQHQMNAQDDVPNPLHQWTHQLQHSIKQFPGNSEMELISLTQWVVPMRKADGGIWNDLQSKHVAVLRSSRRALPVCHGDPILIYRFASAFVRISGG